MGHFAKVSFTPTLSHRRPRLSSTPTEPRKSSPDNRSMRSKANEPEKMICHAPHGEPRQASATMHGHRSRTFISSMDAEERWAAADAATSDPKFLSMEFTVSSSVALSMAATCNCRMCTLLLAPSMSFFRSRTRRSRSW